MNYSLRMKRLLVGSAAGAMVLATVPTGIAAASVEDVCEGAEDNEFDDVAETNSHKENIDCLASYAITVGDSAGNYNPGEAVTRGQMATFIARFITQAEEGSLDVPDDAEDAFDDDDGTTHEDAINYLASIDVVSGTSATTFEPGAEVTRGQMARFIVQALEYLGVDVPEDAEDAFDDDDGTTHEEMINILAELQVVSGFNDGTYRPGESVTRQQMATYVIGGAGVAEEQGEWNGVMQDPPPPPGESNQTFEVTPDEDQTVVDDGDTVATATDDNVQFEVENPAAGEEHDIILVDAALVSVDDDGVVSFLDAAGDPEDQGYIEETAALNSEIVVVNGSTTAGGQYAAAAPVGGNLTFTVNSNGYEDYVAVVFFDEDGDTRLDLDNNGVPEEQEAFGVSGVVSVLPQEAATGSIVADSEIHGVNKAENYVVIDLGATGNATPATPRVVFYEEGDEFYVDGSDLGDQVSMAEFEEVLTVGDTLDADTAYSRNFQSEIVLNNLEPNAPEFVDPVTVANSIEATDTSAELDVDASTVISGATVNVYLAEDGDAFTAAELVASSDADEDSTEAEWQITIDGLDENTAYEVYLTQEIDGEESAPNETTASAATGFSTTVSPGDLAIESVTVNDVNDGTTGANSDEIIVVFNEDATLDTANSDNTDVYVYPTGQPGFRINSAADVGGDVTITSGDTSDTWVIELSSALNDAANDIEYTVVIGAGVADDDDGAPNARLSATFNY